MEADELRAARLQSLVAALDKAKLFLRRQPRELRVRSPARRSDGEAPGSFRRALLSLTVWNASGQRRGAR